MSIDVSLSTRVFKTTKESWVLKHLAVFLADDLIWLMIGIVYGLLLWDGAALVARPIMTALYLGASLFVPWLLTFLISHFVQRPRPYQVTGVKPIMKPFIETSSFPSSHATFVFALLVVVVTMSWWWIVAIGAVLVAVGRVAVGVHYVSDVVTGALVGLIVGAAFQIAVVFVLLPTSLFL